MSLDFTDRRVAVCGGSRGIGRSIALAFAEAGAAVSVCARGAAGLEAVRNELAGFGGTTHAGACDLGDGTAIQRYVEGAAEALGGLDILVNNASGLGMGNEEPAWEAGVAVDLLATVRATRAALPYLERSDGGSIVNITSISGYRASARNPAYAAVKAALVNLTQSQAAALAPQRIRVNAVAPGSVEFPGGLWEQRRRQDPAYYEATRAGIPFGRLGRPQEIASVVLFLASPLAAWVTGQTLIVDGGQLLS